MLSHTLRHPLSWLSEYSTVTLNLYDTIILTFLATILQESSACTALEHTVPREELAVFLVNIPHRNISGAGGRGVER